MQEHDLLLGGESSGGLKIRGHDQPDLSDLIENDLISDKNLEKVSYLDGVKYYYDDQSWISIRFSGTEPLLRIYMEMKSKEEVQAILKFLKNDLEI